MVLLDKLCSLYLLHSMLFDNLNAEGVIRAAHVSVNILRHLHSFLVILRLDVAPEMTSVEAW